MNEQPDTVLDRAANHTYTIGPPGGEVSNYVELGDHVTWTFAYLPFITVLTDDWNDWNEWKQWIGPVQVKRSTCNTLVNIIHCMI